MKSQHRVCCLLVCLGFATASLTASPAVAAESPASTRSQADFSPRPDERQLPRRMRSAMSVLPAIRVGQAEADIVGADNRALQAAVDYLAGLGGGVVEIGPGQYLMRDSLHLRSFITVRGTAGKTILRKADGAVSPLALDGDYGEEQITLTDPAGFDVGLGVAVWDSSAAGFHTTVARITGRRNNTFSISQPLNADCMLFRNAKAATVFPVVSACNAESVRMENLIIDGNASRNVALNGCRGAGIYLLRSPRAVIHACQVRNFNGDGISFQQSNDVTITQCLSENNTALGIHPGSGSQRPTVRQCVARGNGQDGLFLCWRVRHGLFEDNLIESNGRYGISIGHKDSDNIFRGNRIRTNRQDGICFREESLGMAAHRNRLERNLIEDNGLTEEVAGIRIRGQTNDLVLTNNIIRDTRPAGQRHQLIGVLIESEVGPVTLEANSIEAATPIRDQRPASRTENRIGR